MRLAKAIITNFRGIRDTTSVNIDQFTCIVGQNDAGKSTILKAINAAINDLPLLSTDLNVDTQNTEVCIELLFEVNNKSVQLFEESINTTLEEENITNEQNLLHIKKTWNITSTSPTKPKTAVRRLRYTEENDFLLLNEASLIKLCKKHGIDTTKGNGATFNNVEKRAKLRTLFNEQKIEYSYVFEDIPSTGTGKPKQLWDSIKDILPSFEYFKADSSLSDSDASIQKHFKEMALSYIKSNVNYQEIETIIIEKLNAVLEKVTSKINDVVDSTEQVLPKVEFDWNKLISTTFVSKTTDKDIPLSSRGDGFRRITMMSYFEYLAEEENTDAKPMIFAFEEPETFLHPSAQENLFKKLMSLADNKYQVLISTHSPIIVGNTPISNISLVTKSKGSYELFQSDLDYKKIASDLGIKPDNQLFDLYNTAKALLLVEGIDDAKALKHNANLYKQNALIDSTFDELGIIIIPIGGCSAIKHWVSLDLLKSLQKPFFIFLDSDKNSENEQSPNEKKLLNLGFAKNKDFHITKKRLLECYIPHTALKRIEPRFTLTYGDFDHVKNLIKNYHDDSVKGKLGGGNVVEKHYENLNFDDLRQTWFDGMTDEFVYLYQAIIRKLQ